MGVETESERGNEGKKRKDEKRKEKTKKENTSDTGYNLKKSNNREFGGGEGTRRKDEGETSKKKGDVSFMPLAD